MQLHVKCLAVVILGLLVTGVAVAQSEWTIMIFMNGDNNLEPDALLNFKQLARVGSTTQVNVVVQFDRIGKYAHTDPDWTQTLRFRVTKDMKPLPANAVQDIGEANMGDPIVLRDFVRWARTTYPAKKYMLIIWDHGQGWRVMVAQLLNRNRELARARAYVSGTTITMQQSNAVLLRQGSGVAVPTGETAPFRSAPGDPYRSASNDETDNDVLYNREIHDGLTAALGGEKLDIIGFDACLMSMLETAYAFRDVAHYLVGSEELEPGLGWPYDRWLATITGNPTAPADMVARSVVSAYGDFYSDTSQPNWDPTTTMSVIDLARVDHVVTTLDLVSDELTKAISTNLQDIIEARADTNTFAPGYEFHHIDLNRLLTVLSRKKLPQQTLLAIHSCESALANAVLQSYAGADRQGGTYGARGLAIYYPKTESEYSSDPYAEGGYEKANASYPVAFVAEHRWSDFLHAYWSKVP